MPPIAMSNTKIHNAAKAKLFDTIYQQIFKAQK